MKIIRSHSNFLEKRTSFLALFTFMLLLGSVWQSAAWANPNKDAAVYNPEPQARIVSGKVTDKDGMPLMGVNIIVENTKVGTETNFDGLYELVLPENATTLVFSFVGFETQKITIGNKKQIDVTMVEDANVLDEIVVTGYQTISRERATGSFAKIDEMKLELRPVQNIIDKLDGLAAGVNYTNGRIEIRGRSSINASTRPLYVIDNFPVEGNMATINPEDVESITVLKDASAASIWGVRASNGVVVITTKKGRKNQKLQVDFSSYLAVTERIDYSDMGMMNTSDQIDVELEYTEKGWNNFENMVNRFQSLTLLEEAEVLVRGFAPNGDIWSRAEYDRFVADLRSRDAEKQWEQFLLRNPIEETYNLAVSGGSEKNMYRVSMVYNRNQEAAVGNTNNRIIFNIQDSYRLTDRIGFNAGINASLRNNYNNGVSSYSMRREKPYNNLFNANGQTIPYYTRWNKWVSQERESINGLGSYAFNYYDEQRYSDNSSQNFDIRAKFGLDFEIVKDLTFTTSFQYEKGSYRSDVFNTMDLPSFRVKVWDMYADPDITDDDDTPDFQIPLGTEYRYGRESFYAWDFRNTLNWDKTWNVHHLNVFGGTEIRKDYFEYFRDKKYGYNKQTTTYVPVDNEAFVGGQRFNWNGERFRDNFYFTNNYDNREVSVFSNLGYEYDKRYSVTGSFRIDQKNLFGSDPAFRYKPLWSAGLGWNISNEGFMDDVNWVDRLRFRATYGLTGNASNRYSPYAQAKNYTRSWGANLYDFLRLTQPANDKLKWEETTTLNLGFDFAFFKNRLSGSVDYYSKHSQDLLGPRQLDVTNGFREAVINYASMDNKGYEIVLNAIPVMTNDFSWNLGFNFSYNDNTVTEIEDQIQTPRNLAQYGKLAVDMPYNNIYSYNYAGLDNTGNVLLYNTDGSTKLWREGVNDEDELIYQGLSVAPYYGGMTNTFAYKGFDLTLNLTYKFGYVFRNRTLTDGYSGWKGRINKVYLDRWRKPGDEATTRIPKIAYEGLNPHSGDYESHFDNIDADHFWLYGQDNIYSANHIRVRDIILGYTMPQKYLNRTFIRNFRVTGQVTNPFIWVANDLGIDPELANSSNPRVGFDNLKTFTLGVRLTF